MQIVMLLAKEFSAGTEIEIFSIHFTTSQIMNCTVRIMYRQMAKQQWDKIAVT